MNNQMNKNAASTVLLALAIAAGASGDLAPLSFIERGREGLDTWQAWIDKIAEIKARYPAPGDAT